MLVVVDDSPSIDGEIFNLEEFEGADWVLISDDVPVDEAQRDELLETFQATYHGGDGRAVARTPPTTTRTRSSRTPRTSFTDEDECHPRLTPVPRGRRPAPRVWRVGFRAPCAPSTS